MGSRFVGSDLCPSVLDSKKDTVGTILKHPTRIFFIRNSIRTSVVEFLKKNNRLGLVTC